MTTAARDTDALVLHAEHSPQSAVANPGPHQTYRNPSLAIESREVGALAPGSVRAEVIYGGICGTDLHAVQADPLTGYIVGTAPLSIPADGRVLGHEAVGRVVEVGSGVSDLRPGALVTFESILRCHRCEPCRRGDPNQCRQSRLVGMERDGLFTTRADMPAVLVHDVSDLETDMGLLAATCIEPAACAFVACSACRVAPGDAVVVLGAGPIGVFAAMACRLALGASEVHIVEPVAARRELAEPWVDRAWGVEEFFADGSGLGIDVLIETSGELERFDALLERVEPNGRIALLARRGAPLTVRNVDLLITRNVSLVGSRGHLGRSFTTVLRLVRAGRLPLHEAVSVIGEGLPALQRLLEDPGPMIADRTKSVVRLGDPG